MLFVYPAVFHKENNAYWAEFPDLKGCSTYGHNITETMANAQEALAGYLSVIIEKNQNIVSPSDISEVLYNKEDSFVTLVRCDVDQYTVTIPRWLNKQAISMGINFSKVLQEALKEKIQKIQMNKVD